jgi:dephospho-CoA kinase
MILGITGTDGAGKGTVVEYLVDHHGYTHYSARAFILEEIRKQGLPDTRNQMRLTANELRKQHGNEFLIKVSLEKARADGVSNAVIESLRATAEAECLKAHGGILLAVDADQQLRYERVQARRSESDQVSFAEFQRHEELEKNDPDPHGMQKAKVMEMADYTVTNNGTVEELKQQVEQFLATQQV